MTGTAQVHSSDGTLAALLFAPGMRPGHATLAPRVEIAPGTGAGQAGLAELRRDGLAFDLTGLAPAAAPAFAAAGLRTGLAAGFDASACEAMLLAPGPDLAHAAGLLPVVRAAAGLVAALADLPGLVAVAWLPAGTLVAPNWFVDGVLPWLAGGPFPALVLAGLVRGADRVTSTGLTALVGQDFVLETGGPRPDGHHARLAVRLVDWLVAHGPVRGACVADLPGMGAVWLEPQDGGFILARCR